MRCLSIQSKAELALYALNDCLAYHVLHPQPEKIVQQETESDKAFLGGSPVVTLNVKCKSPETRDVPVIACSPSAINLCFCGNSITLSKFGMCFSASSQVFCNRVSLRSFVTFVLWVTTDSVLARALPVAHSDSGMLAGLSTHMVVK